MQMHKDNHAATEQAPESHPEPEAYRLATSILAGAFKALNENDAREIEENARFLSDTREDGLLYFWLKTQAAKDPQGSMRLRICGEVGRKAMFYWQQAKFMLRDSRLCQTKKTHELVRMFHKIKKIPELECLG